MQPRDDEAYRPDIDGLRAIAVLAVLGFHAFPAFVPGGYVGVDVFFVISGYLITGILQRALDGGTFSITGFYARRIRRIFPALIVVLATTLVAGWFLLIPERYANLGTHTTGAAAFASNIVSWSEAGYFDAAALDKPLLHLWSLGIEEQFYLVWPALLWLLARLRAPVLAVLCGLVATSLVLGIVLTSRAPDAAFYLPGGRIWELAIGGVLAVSGRRAGGTLLGALGLGAIAVAIAAFDGDSPYPGWRALVPTLGTCLVIASGPASLLHRKVLGARPLVLVGLISYPLYLWHWVLLALGLSPLVALAASFVLATVTYLAVETPLRKRRASTRQALALVGALCVVAAAGSAIKVLDGVPSRYPEEVRGLLAYRYDYLSDAHNGTCWLLKRAPPDAFSASCFPAPGDQRPSLFVWGDSFAARLRPGLEAVLGARYAIGSAARAACPPSLRETGTCLASNEFVLERLERTRPAVVILFARWNLASPDVVEGALASAARLARAGSRVLVLGPAPQWTPDLPTAIYEAWKVSSFRGPAPRRIFTQLQQTAFETDRRMRALPWARGVTYVSVIDLLCNSDGCLTYVPGTSNELMAYDFGHLTTPGAATLTRALPLPEN